jgi:hypothetical protein
MISSPLAIALREQKCLALVEAGEWVFLVEKLVRENFPMPEILAVIKL